MKGDEDAAEIGRFYQRFPSFGDRFESGDAS